MKKHAVLCTNPDERLMAAFGLAFSGLPSPRYQTWQMLLARRPDLLERTQVELMYCEHAQWIRISPPRPPALHLGRGGRQRCLMEYAEEVAFIAELEQRARKGERITADDIVAEIATRTGRRTTRQTVSDMLRRQGLVRVGVKPIWERAWDKARRQGKRPSSRSASTKESKTKTLTAATSSTVAREQEPPAAGQAVAPQPTPMPPALPAHAFPVPELVG